MTPINIGLIQLFDAHLHEREISYSSSIIGGAAIMLIASSQRSTGDIDSLHRIPNEIVAEIVSFATIHGLDPRWFNDIASRNFHEFVRKGEDVYAKLVFDGKALKLYTPSVKTLILSKIYPILDRPEEGKDLQDIEALIEAGVVTRTDFENAISAFDDNIRFEDDRDLRKISRELISMLRLFAASAFR